MKRNSSIQPFAQGFLLLLLSFIALDCQRVISVDLNSAAPEIVIEGSISDSTGPYYVTLSKTVNFDQPNTFPPVAGAHIVMSDNLGHSDLLTETSLSGTYVASTLQGTPGRTYTLDVTADGKEYLASSTMPLPVGIDSLAIENSPFGSNLRKLIDAHFTDPPGIKNYYRFVVMRNGIISPNIYLYDDRIQDGQPITSVLSVDTLQTGDTLVVFLQGIDEGVYNYFRTAAQISGDRGSFSASPANPLSNFNNGALGYFSAYAVRSKLIIAP